jgi:hypothetical protein
VFGTKAVSGIRHYVIEDRRTKSKVKVLDLFIAIVIGLVPILNFLASVMAILATLFFIVIEVLEYQKGFFNKNLFGGNDDE